MSTETFITYKGYLSRNWFEGEESTYAGLDKLMTNSIEECKKCPSFGSCRTNYGYTRLVGALTIFGYNGDVNSKDCVLKINEGRNCL